jgi:hypothetical protein
VCTGRGNLSAPRSPADKQLLGTTTKKHRLLLVIHMRSRLPRTHEQLSPTLVLLSHFASPFTSRSGAFVINKLATLLHLEQTSTCRNGGCFPHRPNAFNEWRLKLEKYVAGPQIPWVPVRQLAEHRHVATSCSLLEYILINNNVYHAGMHVFRREVGLARPT